MSSINVKKSLLQKKTRDYLNKDFDGFRSALLQYAKTYYPDQIKDFSDSSVGGMFVDLAAYVGDTMSFYLDHQFNETNLVTAVEPNNIERLIRQAGVKITGAAPALASVNLYVRVESEVVSGVYQPRKNYLPTVKAGSKFQSSAGIIFELLENVDFAEEKSSGDLNANVAIYSSDASGNPASYGITKTGIVTSGETTTETFNIPDNFQPFRSLTLSKSDVSEILRVIDSDLNEYYEVDSLNHDVAYKRVQNTNQDSDKVSDSLYIVPAPYRFISNTTLNTAITTITFGSGRADSLDDDVLPDPSGVSLTLYGDRKTFTRIAIDPNALLETKSLGITPSNTVITIRYRAGGGLNHNVAANTIRTVYSLTTEFNVGVPSAKVAQIRTSLEITNPQQASGGEDIPTLNEFRNIALNFRNAQSRLVTKSDLVARVYTMPSNLGRVYRTATRSNPTKPLSSLLYIVSRDSSGYLVISPDTLKKNLAKYLNEFRLTSDAIDILDAAIVNLTFKYTVVLDTSVDKTTTITTLNNKIGEYLKTGNFQIDQPIVVSDLINIILNQDGVVSLDRYEFNNIIDVVNERSYSQVSYSLANNTRRGIINPPVGGIFELKYPSFDIIGNAV